LLPQLVRTSGESVSSRIKETVDILSNVSAIAE